MVSSTIPPQAKQLEMAHEEQRAWTDPKIPLLGVILNGTSWRSVRISDCPKEKKAAKRKCEYILIVYIVELPFNCYVMCAIRKIIM